MEVLDLSGGINWRDPAYKLRANQCVRMENLRYTNSYIESIPGTIKYHQTSLGSNPVTAIMPYYDEENGIYALLAACGSDIFKRDEATGEFTSIKGGLIANQITDSVIRYSTMYIPHPQDGLLRYEGGTDIYKVGTGATVPSPFKFIVWDKGTDRMFGIDAKGNLYWCNGQDPETWDAANVDKIKLQDGETMERAGMLYGKLIIFCTYSVWIYYIAGNEENWKLEQSPTLVGLTAPNTLRRGGKGFLFYSASGKTTPGIYTFNGSISELLTDDVTPLIKLINEEFKEDCAAEYHADLYTFTFPYGFSEVNNCSIDLDMSNIKEDGSPAIYGPHTLAFRSSAVLSTRQKNGEFLMGDVSNGFICREGGVTFNSLTGIDGTLIYQRFLSTIHNDANWNMMKQYRTLYAYFKPTTYYQAKLRHYVSYGAYAREFPFYPQVETSSHYGDYDIFEKRLWGSPELYRFDQDLGLESRGTSIQIEIINDVVAQRLFLQGYGYEKSDLYKIKQCDSYAL